MLYCKVYIVTKQFSKSNRILYLAIDEFQNENMDEDNDGYYLSSMIGSIQKFLTDPEPNEDKDANKTDSECLVELWKCLSGTLEDVVRVIHSRSSILTSVQTVFAKIAFHGPHRSLWESLMSVPKVLKLYHQ